MSRITRKQTMWLTNRSDTNRAVPPQKMARGWKFWIYKLEELYYLCSKKKDAFTAKLIYAFVFAYAKCWFSHDGTQMTALKVYE